MIKVKAKVRKKKDNIAIAETAKDNSKKIAVIRVRGIVRVKGDIKFTLDLLRLYKKNFCTIVENNPNYMGMINKVKYFATFGEIDEATQKMLIEKKGELYKGRLKDRKGKIDYSSRYFEYDNKKFKKFFRLNSPKHGYGRKGTKKPFSQAGALGYRGTKINDLIKRML